MIIHRFLTSILIFVSLALAQTALAEVNSCSGTILGKSNAQLQADLDACNQEIAKWTDILNSTKQNTASYATEVAKLTAKINAAKATIKAKGIAIANLNVNITEKQSEINKLENKIDVNIESIAELVRKTREIDAFSLAEAILSEQDFSNFFADVDAYTSTRSSIIILVDSLRGVKSETEIKKAELAKERDKEAEAKAIIEANKKKVEQSQAEQKVLLTQSQNQEKAYSNLVAEKKAKAESIRTALFGLRDSVAIPFSLALQYAQEAGGKTGVRPALILGILRQESALGSNVGSCIITDLQSGQTRGVVGKLDGVIFSNGIHPTRDLPLVQTIIGGLSKDPINTRISCPISSTFGYGGAMGPAQFIPSTWVCVAGYVNKQIGKCGPDYKGGPWYGPWEYQTNRDRIQSSSGTIPNPWNAQDAIMAMAIFLRDLGAGTGIYQNERTAACKYYSGSNCYTINNNPGKGLKYGVDVMNFAASYQRDIDYLQGN